MFKAHKTSYLSKMLTAITLIKLDEIIAIIKDVHLPFSIAYFCKDFLYTDCAVNVEIN